MVTSTVDEQASEVVEEQVSAVVEESVSQTNLTSQVFALEQAS